MLDTLRQADLGERAADERAYARQTAMEHRPCAARDAHISRLEYLERQDRGVADPEWNGYNEFSLIEMARDRGHENVARLPCPSVSHCTGLDSIYSSDLYNS